MAAVSEKIVDDLKVKARASGRTDDKIAYAKAKRTLDDAKQTVFSDEYPYAVSPAPEYLEALRQQAEGGDSDAVMRYEIMRANREYVDYKIAGDDVKGNRAAEAQLRRKVAAGETLTAADVQKAAEALQRNGSIENRVLYAKIRREASK